MKKKKLKKIIKRLDELLDEIEKITKENPTIPSDPLKDYPKPPQLGRITKCSLCGLELAGIMGYVCTNIDCPTFVQPRCF